MKYFNGFRVKWWVASIGCLLILAFAVVLWPRSVRPGLSVHFVGFTNAPGQSRMATFSVTNPNKRSIHFITGPPQIRVEGKWPEHIDWETAENTGLLKPGQATNVTVVCPLTNNWRLPCFWSFEPNRADMVIGRCRNLLHTLKDGSFSGWNFSWALTSYTNYSPPINQEPAHTATLR